MTMAQFSRKWRRKTGKCIYLGASRKTLKEGYWRTEGLIGSAGGNKKETSRQSVKENYNCILNKMKIFFMVVIGTKGCVQ